MHSQNVVLTSTCYNFTEHDEFCEKPTINYAGKMCLELQHLDADINGSGSLRNILCQVL